MNANSAKIFWVCNLKGVRGGGGGGGSGRRGGDGGVFV